MKTVYSELFYSEELSSLGKSFGLIRQNRQDCVLLGTDILSILLFLSYKNDRIVN